MNGSRANRLRSKMRANAADAICMMIGRPEFAPLVDLITEVYETLSADEQVRFTEALDERVQLLRQRQENGEILAAEGREARKLKTAERAADICRIYQRVRPSYPEGRAGNGAALAAVAEQYGSAGDRRTPITKQAIRKILKRSGIPCR